MSQTVIRGRVIRNPAMTRFLFGSTTMSWLWLVVRLWLGYGWIKAALPKVTDAEWVTTGAALKKFWERAVVVPPAGRPPIAFDWYRDFIRYLLNTETHTWFGKMIAYGEFVVGIALIVGAFVGIAAFAGAFMNWNYMMAGSASFNPVFFTLAILLMLAWKVAGYIGLDYYILPCLGTPRNPARILTRETVPRLPPIRRTIV